MPKVYLQKLIKILNVYENESRYKLTIIFSCLRQHKITLTTAQKSKNTCMCRVRNSNLFRVAHNLRWLWRGRGVSRCQRSYVVNLSTEGLKNPQNLVNVVYEWHLMIPFCIFEIIYHNSFLKYFTTMIDAHNSTYSMNE